MQRGAFGYVFVLGLGLLAAGTAGAEPRLASRRHLQIAAVELGGGGSISLGDDHLGGAAGLRLLGYERRGLYVTALHIVAIDARRYGALAFMTEVGLHQPLDDKGKLALQVGAGVGFGMSWWDACPEPPFIYCKTGSPLVFSPHVRLVNAENPIARLGVSLRLLAAFPERDADFPGYETLKWGVGVMLAVDAGAGVPLAD